MGKKERSSRVQELMERVGMSHRLDHFPDTLSGGTTAGGDRPGIDPSAQLGSG